MIDGKEFWCPNGHAQIYSKNKNATIADLTLKVSEISKDNELLKKELRELKCDLMSVNNDKSLLIKIKEKWL